MTTQQKWDSINKTKLNATQKEGHGEMAEAIGILGWENTEVKEAVDDVHNHFAKKAPELLKDSAGGLVSIKSAPSDREKADAALALAKAKIQILKLKLKLKK